MKSEALREADQPAITACAICGAEDGTQALWQYEGGGCLFVSQWASLSDGEREHVLAHGIAAP